MWSLIPSLEFVVYGVSVAFTAPSFRTQCEMILGWVLCLGRHTEYRVFETIWADQTISRNERHPFDRFYNFFNRSAWQVSTLAKTLAIQIVLKLKLNGKLTLIVDDTLLHKTGKCVFGIGWFHDAVASTKTRIVTAPGNNWVVIGLVVSVPFTDQLFCLPIHARLRRSGKEYPGPAQLAREMLQEVLNWFPDREFVLIGDGGYSSGKLLQQLPSQVTYLGLMRADASLNDPHQAVRPKSMSGPKPKYGPRILSPREKAKQLDRDQKKNKSKNSKHKSWKRISLRAYGEQRRFDVFSFQAVWPKVFGSRPILVVLCRGLDAGYDEVCLYTTDLQADLAEVVGTYAKRVLIEGVFKNSKQVMQIDKPQHWSESSIKKIAPWVWLMQSLVTLWYLSQGRKLPEAKQARKNLGEWDNEFSFRHMARMLRRLTIRQTIQRKSHKKHDLYELTCQLENYLFIAA